MSTYPSLLTCRIPEYTTTINNVSAHWNTREVHPPPTTLPTTATATKRQGEGNSQAKKGTENERASEVGRWVAGGCGPLPPQHSPTARGPQGHTPQGESSRHHPAPPRGSRTGGHRRESSDGTDGAIGKRPCSIGATSPRVPCQLRIQDPSVPEQNRHFAESHSAKALGDFKFP